MGCYDDRVRLEKHPVRLVQRSEVAVPFSGLSFVMPLASMKNSKERFQRRHLGPTLVGLPLQSNGLMFPNSMFTAISVSFHLGDY